MDKPERIIELLKKLKAMADGGATEGERQAAQNRIDHIKKEYNVTDDELNTDVEVEHELKFKQDKKTATILYAVIRAYTTEEQELDVRFYNKKYSKYLGFSVYFKIKVSRRHFIDIDVAIKYYLNAFKNDLKSLLKEHLKKRKQQLNRQKREFKYYWFDDNELKRKHRIARGNLNRKFKKEIEDFCDAFWMKHELYRKYDASNSEDASGNSGDISIELQTKEDSKPTSAAERKRMEREWRAWDKANERVTSETLPKPINLLNEENPLMLTN